MRLLSMDDFEVWLLKCFFYIVHVFFVVGVFLFLMQLNGMTPSGHRYFGEKKKYFFRKLIQTLVVGGKKGASACAHQVRTFPARCLLLFSNI